MQGLELSLWTIGQGLLQVPYAEKTGPLEGIIHRVNSAIRENFPRGKKSPLQGTGKEREG